MDSSFMETGYALLRIAVCFAVILIPTRRRCPLEWSLAAAGLCLAFMSGMNPLDWARVAGKTLISTDLFAVLCSLFVILLLSGLMEHTCQTQRLVHSVERYITSKRLQLFLFPAFIGFFPVPGGAIFSCPIVVESSKGMPVSIEQKALINYWFRHVWELSWPLFPGFILYVGLADIPPAQALMYNWPACFAAIAGGWFILLRRLQYTQEQSFIAEKKEDDTPNSALPLSGEHSQASKDAEPSQAPMHYSAIWESMPMWLGIVFAFTGMSLSSDIPVGFIFALAFVPSLFLCMYQNKLGLRSLIPLIKAERTRSILLIVVSIFVFKNILMASNLFEPLLILAQNSYTMFLLCTLLPLLSGILTGLMVAFVGVAFPMLIAIIEQGGLWEERLPWLTLALMFGNIGQMLSPVHLCLVVSCRYFEISMSTMMRKLFLLCLFLATVAIGWFLLLRHFAVTV